MNDFTNRHCPDCDAVLTHPKLLLCHACWARLPVALRQGFNHAIDLSQRRANYRLILEHIRERKENPELMLNVPAFAKATVGREH